MKNILITSSRADRLWRNLFKAEPVAFFTLFRCRHSRLVRFCRKPSTKAVDRNTMSWNIMVLQTFSAHLLVNNEHLLDYISNKLSIKKTCMFTCTSMLVHHVHIVFTVELNYKYTTCTNTYWYTGTCWGTWMM